MPISSFDNFLTVSDCPSYLQEKFGNRVHIATCHRWIKTGIAGVRLETLFVGGRRYTSVEALERFFQESTEAKKRKQRTEQANTNSRAKHAEAEAKRLGI
jgi:hypothetical protein